MIFCWKIDVSITDSQTSPDTRFSLGLLKKSNLFLDFSQCDSVPPLCVSV